MYRWDSDWDETVDLARTTINAIGNGLASVVVAKAEALESRSMSDEVNCQACHAVPGTSPGFSRVASISGSINGDECTESVYFCASCACYTVEVYWDIFSGEESASLQGPLPKEKGDALVATIQKCETPYEKKCRCSAHREYFGPSLD